MAESSAPPARTLRRGLFGLVGIAIAVMGILVASQIGTLFPGGAVAATSSPGPATPPAPSPTLVAVEPTGSPAPPTEPPPSTPPPPTLVPAPLTGLPVTPEAASQHVIAVMVDDLSPARPQSGLNSASIVWHAPAEGGIPRYMMLFQDTVPGGVGPVRSSREYYIEWASEWNAMYAHAGGSPQALATLRSKGHGQWVYNTDEFRWSHFFWRTKDRFAPHNLYTDGQHLRALAKRVGAIDGPIKPVWTFAPDADPLVRPRGGTIRIDYPTEIITYRYDAASNTYIRYINSSKQPQRDRVGNQIVAPKNVVILRMRFGPLNDGHPQKHRLEANDVGRGVAYIATNGYTIKGEWRKASPTAPTLLFDQAGNPVTLTAGQTFVQVISLSYTYSIKAGQPPLWISPKRRLDV